MRLLIILFALLLLLSIIGQAWAWDDPPRPGDQFNSLTVLHPAPGVSYLYDQSGNSSTVYEQSPGMAWYSTEDRHGQITAQGFVFEPLPPPKPLEVPRSMRPSEYQERRR